MDPISRLHTLGQSLWYDNIQRQMLKNGSLAAMINRGEIRGITSNPSIFQNAIERSSDYDAALLPMAWSGWNAAQVIDQLMLEDIVAAADLFLPLYQSSNGADGYVSLEVNPSLAHSADDTFREAQRLFALANRPNVMIKIPATREGLPAVTAAIAAGINVNVTLIFSLKRYQEVMEAYLAGLEQRTKAGQAIRGITSVASFFVSRVDTKIDAILVKKAKIGDITAKQLKELAGKAAVANAKLAYAQYQEVFGGERFKRLKDLGARVQRPLWASTSTKNPDYSDVLYVDELIGPETVNTVPPQTLDAYRDHGKPALTLASGIDAAQKAIRDLESAGIFMDQVTAELETEGVDAFYKAFQSLQKTAGERIAAAQKQLGSLKPGVSEWINDPAHASTGKRFWTGDPTLWTKDQTGQEEIKKRLGWLGLPVSSAALVEEVNALKLQLMNEGYTDVLLLGMGGSSLAPEVLQTIFTTFQPAEKPAGLKVSILDSTDPDQVHAALKQSTPRSTLYMVSSKSGSTIEVNAFFNYSWNYCQRTIKDNLGKHFIAITDPGTSLEKLAVEKGFRKVFSGDPLVGGRYSALSAFGIVPAGLMGWDLACLLASSARMKQECGAEVPTGRNPGLVLGVIMAVAAKQGKDKLTILADAEWQVMGTWLEQLIAESSGKQGLGIVPIEGEEIAVPLLYAKDRLFVYLRKDGSCDEKIHRLEQAGHPVLMLDIREPEEIAAEFYRWEFSTAVACAILQVNAFDQPDVQDNKTRTVQKINAYIRDGRFEVEKPIWENSQACVYGAGFPGLETAETLADVVTAFLHLSKTGDYLALNAYLPRNSRTINRLNKVRNALRKQTKLATTVGFGPRFLHSTGQLHKGGGNNGIFIQITKDPGHDLKIPGSDYSFEVLEHAQALGDLEALQARNRRVMRVHLLDADVLDLI